MLRTESIDFAALADVTPSIAPQYGQTSFDAATGILYTDVALANQGTFLTDTPLLLAIDGLSDPSITPIDADGYTPDGVPYFEFTSLVTGGTLNPADVTARCALGFVNPQGVQFTFQPHVLAMLNHDPRITSTPIESALK